MNGQYILTWNFDDKIFSETVKVVNSKVVDCIKDEGVLSEWGTGCISHDLVSNIRLFDTQMNEVSTDLLYY